MAASQCRVPSTTAPATAAQPIELAFLVEQKPADFSRDEQGRYHDQRNGGDRLIDTLRLTAEGKSEYIQLANQAHFTQVSQVLEEFLTYVHHTTWVDPSGLAMGRTRFRHTQSTYGTSCMLFCVTTIFTSKNQIDPNRAMSIMDTSYLQQHMGRCWQRVHSLVSLVIRNSSQ